MHKKTQHPQRETHMWLRLTVACLTLEVSTVEVLLPPTIDLANSHQQSICMQILLQILDRLLYICKALSYCGIDLYIGERFSLL